jgi:hypothetical protein
MPPTSITPAAPLVSPPKPMSPPKPEIPPPPPNKGLSTVVLPQPKSKKPIARDPRRIDERQVMSNTSANAERLAQEQLPESAGD